MHKNECKKFDIRIDILKQNMKNNFLDKIFLKMQKSFIVHFDKCFTFSTEFHGFSEFLSCFLINIKRRFKMLFSCYFYANLTCKMAPYEILTFFYHKTNDSEDF